MILFLFFMAWLRFYKRGRHTEYTVIFWGLLKLYINREEKRQWNARTLLYQKRRCLCQLFTFLYRLVVFHLAYLHGILHHRQKLGQTRHKDMRTSRNTSNTVSQCLSIVYLNPSQRSQRSFSDRSQSHYKYKLSSVPVKWFRSNKYIISL